MVAYFLRDCEEASAALPVAAAAAAVARVVTPEPPVAPPGAEGVESVEFRGAPRRVGGGSEVLTDPDSALRSRGADPDPNGDLFTGSRTMSRPRTNLAKFPELRCCCNSGHWSFLFLSEAAQRSSCI